MTLPDLPCALTEFRLGNGILLTNFVQGAAPIARHVADTTSLLNTWQQRYQDALETDNYDIQSRAKAVLKLLTESSQDIVLLMWPKVHLTVLLSPDSKEFYVFDNTADSPSSVPRS